MNPAIIKIIGYVAMGVGMAANIVSSHVDKVMRDEKIKEVSLILLITGSLEERQEILRALKSLADVFHIKLDIPRLRQLETWQSYDITTKPLKDYSVYLPTLTFTPNEHEQETLSDYILWGKDPATGLNSQQDGDLTIKEWAPATNIDSLEGMLDIPGFNENQLRPLEGTHYRTKRVVFDREDALSKASPT